MQIPIFYSALMLTGVNLLLRIAGTSFQVFISSRIGASGVGLLQLVNSVGNLALVAAIGGIRTAAMYLTAGELGRKRPQNVSRILSACFLYSLICSGLVGTGLYTLAPRLTRLWIGDVRTVPALRLLAAFLPVICLCGVMSGYFTAANRIGTLAIVEILEQLTSMAVSLAALTFWAKENAARACCAVMLGTCAGSCVTLASLLVLRCREHPQCGEPFPIRSRLLRAALPLAGADIVRSGIGTTENLMVPRRLARNPRITDPLASFGIVSGMVFPVMMFPACILFGLAELLIPELARCSAAGSQRRIRYLVSRSLRVSLLYGLFFGGFLFLLGDELCLRLYKNREAGTFLRLYAPLVPMLYCDALTDAMTKGLGQQRICVRYNIITSALDVLFLFFLLPRYGMMGYFVSFLSTHLLNFLLSIRRLMKITGQRIPIRYPLCAVLAAVFSVWISRHLALPVLRASAYPVLLACASCLLGVLGTGDLRWLQNLLHPRQLSRT